MVFNATYAVSALQGSVNVIHYTGTSRGYSKTISSVPGTVKGESMVRDITLCKSLLDVDEGLYYIDDPSNRNRDPQQTIKRAPQRLGESWYDIRYHNCEHFVRWALTEESTSVQMDNSSILFTTLVFGLNEMKNSGHRLLFSAFRLLLFNIILFVLVTKVRGFNVLVTLFAAFSSSCGCELLFIAWKYYFEYGILKGIINADKLDTVSFIDSCVSLVRLIGYGTLSGIFIEHRLEKSFRVERYVSQFYGILF